MNTFQITRSYLAPLVFLAGLAGTLALAPIAHAQQPPGPGQAPSGDPPRGEQSLQAFYSITGHVSCSVDAAGSNNAQHAIKVRKPNAAATVIRAYLLAAATPAGGVIPDGGVRLNGEWVAWEHQVTGGLNHNFRADVTSIVKPVVDAAPPGTITFMASEPFDTAQIDGEVLVAVFHDPEFADDRTVALLFGSQAVDGDTFAISLYEPIDPNEPGAAADMGLAISWSTGGSQRSIVDVQGIRMTSSAGGYDDGYFANGAFITGGGVGDSIENPADPYAQGNSAYDDELYTLLPFIDSTTTDLTVYTLNPSNDDNIFFAHFYFSTAAIVSQAIMLTPLTAEKEFGDQHTLTAAVQDFYGNPIVDTPVTFEVIAGPNAGDTDILNTNLQGAVNWTYVGDGGAGTDQIQASFVDAADEVIFSNVVTCKWIIVNQPPVADAGGPYSGWVNVPIQLDGSGSSDPDNDIVAYEWDCDNDGQFDDAFGVNPAWAFNQPGTHSVGLRVRDSVDQEDDDHTTVEVGNHDPVSDPGGPYQGPPGSTITLDGSGSYDPDPGDSITYAWDLDDDGQFDDSTEVQPQFVIGAVPPGTEYTVCLKVTDSFDANNVNCTTVTADNQPPVCDAGGPYVAECAGATTSVQLDGSASYDPDPGDSLTYEWSSDCPGASFDDPASPTPVLTLDSDCHVSCTVWLLVTDSYNSALSCSTTVTVSDTTAPVFTTAPDNVTFECDGQGNPAEIQDWLNSAAATDACGDVSITHDFTGLSDDCGATGSATVTWTATDDCNLQTTHTATVNIADTAAPTITTPADDLTVECDGSGNSADLSAWLDSHGGAAASDACGGFSWSDDFSGLSDDCGATGSATVTFTATDECQNPATTTATFTIADNTAPTFTNAPDNITFECDGQGNLTDIQTWLDSATATDDCGDVAVTNDFAGLSDDCGETGSATVTWSAVDDCQNETTHIATVTVADTTPPEIVCPPDAFFPYDAPLQDILDWLNSAVASDTCDPDPLIEHDAPTGGFPSGTTTSVTWTATDACGSSAQCSANVEIGATGRVSTTEKGSVLVFPKVELRWDPDGNLIQDTFISLYNDYYYSVRILACFVSELGVKSMEDIELTPNEPTYWSVLTGLPKGVAPFTALGDPYPDPEGTGETILRGFIVLWAVNTNYEQIRWNHLSGGATIMNYATDDAWEYSPYAFQALVGENGEQTGTPGEIKLDGTVYDHAFDKLMLEFFASGAGSFSGAGRVVTHDTDLTLLIVDMDLRQDTQGPYVTKADLRIWNEQEISFSQQFCFTQWHELLLSSHGGYFLVENLQTDRGRAEIDAVASSECPGSTDRALVGVVAKILAFDSGPSMPAAGSFLVGTGTETTEILYDMLPPGPGKHPAR